MWVQPNTSVVRAIARGQWQAPLGSSRGRPPRSRAACRRARVRQGQAFGGAEEAPSLTATARDGGGNVRSGWKNARGAGRTKEWSNNARQKWRDAPLTKKAPYKPNATAASAVALALMPTAVAPVPGLAVAPEPHANSPLPAFWRQFAGALGGITVCARPA